MKSNRGQNVRLVVSLFRRFFVSLLRFDPSLVAPASTFLCFDLSLDSPFRFAYLTALAWEGEKVEFSLELHEVV